jgi:hypothetical protein
MSAVSAVIKIMNAGARKRTATNAQMTVRIMWRRTMTENETFGVFGEPCEEDIARMSLLHRKILGNKIAEIVTEQEMIAFLRAKYALQKQIARHPIDKTKPDNGYAKYRETCHTIVCPNCNGRLKLKSKGQYCDKCGQKLKWGE